MTNPPRMAEPMPPFGLSRRRWLVGALAATLLATVWMAWKDDAGDVVEPTRRTTGNRPLPARSAGAVASFPAVGTGHDSWPLPPRARPTTIVAVDATAWSAQPPAAAAPPARVAVAASAPAAAPPRGAPPFPYTLIGRLDDGQPKALLSSAARSLAVKAGDVVDGEWRVDAVRADSVAMTWMPGNVLQQLRFKPS